MIDLHESQKQLYEATHAFVAATDSFYEDVELLIRLAAALDEVME